MPRVYGITIPAGVEVIYNKTLKMYDFRVHCNIGKNRRFMPRSRKLRLRSFTKLYQVANAWHSLSGAQKDAWYSAADSVGLRGYSLWTQDKIYRLINNIVGNATPSIYHQYKVGKIDIGGVATNTEIRQHHVTPISLPADFKISYKGDLTASGGSPSVKAILRTLRYSGGQNIVEDHEIDLTLSQAWETLELNIPVKQGIMAEWDIIIKLIDVTGELLFDNVFVEFDGEVKTFDPFCSDVTDNWQKTDVPAGVSFESIYPAL